MKEILQNHFFKWRKDALKGKIKKAVMIRISVSREKDPKSKYPISRVKPKEQSRSVNKNNFESLNSNNPPQNINNIKNQRNNHHAILPVITVKVDLTQGKYNNNTFKRTNRSDKSYDNFSYNRNIRNQNIYNNNTHERKNINQNDSNSYYKYSVN